MKPKIVLIDVSVFSHRSIFSWASQVRLRQSGKIKSDFIMPIGYIYFSSLISCLKKIGIDDATQIVMCHDGRDSWRKDHLESYKSNRKENREKHKEINWEKSYEEVNRVNQQLQLATPWIWYQYDRIEADDVMSIICQSFPEMECVIVSIDADLQQLLSLPNVKFFSPMMKYLGTNGCYKYVKDPLAIIANKVRKGDVSDNIRINEDDEDHDFEVREYIINLFKLPEFIQHTIKPDLSSLFQHPATAVVYEDLPFQNSLAKKFHQIFNPEHQISYEASIKSQIKKGVKKNDSNKNKKIRNTKSSRKMADVGKETN